MGGRLHTMDFASLDAAPDGQVVKKIAGLWVAADEGGADYESRTEHDQSNDGDTVAAGVLNVISNATNAVFGLKLPATAGLAIGTKIYFQIDTIDPYYVVVSTQLRGVGGEAILGDGNELGEYHIVAGDQGDFQVFEYIGGVQGDNQWLVGERSWSQAASHKQPVDLASAAPIAAYTASGSDENEILTADANGELIVDGVTVGFATDPWRGGILLRHGADGSDNKVYQVAVPGDGGSPFVLRPRADWRFGKHTRRGAVIPVIGGDTLAGTIFQTSTDKLVGDHGSLSDWVENLAADGTAILQGGLFPSVVARVTRSLAQISAGGDVTEEITGITTDHITANAGYLMVSAQMMTKYAGGQLRQEQYTALLEFTAGVTEPGVRLADFTETNMLSDGVGFASIEAGHSALNGPTGILEMTFEDASGGANGAADTIVVMTVSEYYEK